MITLYKNDAYCWEKKKKREETIHSNIICVTRLSKVRYCSVSADRHPYTHHLLITIYLTLLIETLSIYISV